MFRGIFLIQFPFHYPLFLFYTKLIPTEFTIDNWQGTKKKTKYSNSTERDAFNTQYITIYKYSTNFKFNIQYPIQRLASCNYSILKFTSHIRDTITKKEEKKKTKINKEENTFQFQTKRQRKKTNQTFNSWEFTSNKEFKFKFKYQIV